MVAGYVKKIATSVATGDVTVSVEVTKDKLVLVAPLDHQAVVILDEIEFTRIAEAAAKTEAGE